MARIVQYPYALDENNNLVYIKDIQTEHKHDHMFHCPECGQAMVPRIGEHNAHHFAHAENQKCGIESYIHSVAKRILANRFNDRSRPFNVKFWTKHICKTQEGCKFYDQNLCEDNQMDVFNLHETYDLLAREEIRIQGLPEGDFQPDVILQSSSLKHNPIFLEVYHKHRVSPKKRESGQHIIEIRVKDWSELADLDIVDIIQSDRIAFYNFNERKLQPIRFKEKAEQLGREYQMENIDRMLPGCFRSREGQREFQDYGRIVLFHSGKTFFSGIYEDEIKKHRTSAIADITYIRKKVPESFNLMRLLVDRIPKEKRNCFMCCHCVQNDMDVRWCDLVKNGSTRKGTFKEDKGSKCSFFEWFREDDEHPQHDLVEGVDYTIWVNPQ